MTKLDIDSLYGLADDKFVPAINETLLRYKINTPRRVRYFLAQSLFETTSYTKWVENLVYTTPQRIAEVWDTRFTMDRTKVGTYVINKKTGKPYPYPLAYAPEYANNPTKLANNVYAGRNGNGNEASGDGFKFRGRGAFHLTFLSNYMAYSMAVYGDTRIVQNPDLVALPTDAFVSAGWFWDKNGFNALADSDSFTKMTTVLNGSDATVPQRLPMLNKLNAIKAFDLIGK